MNELETILELSRNPVLALEDGRVRMMNTAARLAFPGCGVGDGVSTLLPDSIVFDPAERFVSYVTVGAVGYAVSAARCDGMIYLALTPEDAPEDHAGLSEALMSGMLSALSNIGLAAERLRDTPASDDGETLACIGMLRHSYHTLLRRLRNLNMLCALRDGSMGLTPQRLDLAGLCADVVASTAALTEGAFARLEFCSELDALPACMDAPKVEQLLLNLLVNGLMHTPREGLVRLRLSQSGTNALLSVSDNGSGIPPERLPNVFTGFEREMDPSQLSENPGGGIGLALCRLIAEKHGGTLILESRAGEGTDVRVLLPLVLPGAEALMAKGPEYLNGGMPMILTELSDLLDAEVYVDPLYE